MQIRSGTSYAFPLGPETSTLFIAHPRIFFTYKIVNKKSCTIFSDNINTVGHMVNFVENYFHYIQINIDLIRHILNDTSAKKT